eukprot:9486902-Pyramimonas_sp.AAC.1
MIKPSFARDVYWAEGERDVGSNRHRLSREWTQKTAICKLLRPSHCYSRTCIDESSRRAMPCAHERGEQTR